MWRRESMLRRWGAVKTLAAGMKSVSAVESASPMKSATAIEVVAIDENSAMRDVRIVVEHDVMVMPVLSPVVPAPTKPSKEADAKTQAKCNSRPANVEPWVRIPSWPDSDGRSIYEPWVILRNVNNFRLGGFNYNGLPLLAHLFLRRAL
jgi:hypothetical protein